MTFKNLCSLWLLLAVVSGCSDESGDTRRMTVTGPDGKTIKMDKVNAGVTSPEGDYTVTIAAGYTDGTPASGLGYRLELPSSPAPAVAAKGVLSDTGEAVIEKLAGGFPPVIYYLYVDDKLVGPVGVNAKSETNRFDFLLPAKAGMTAPDLALADLATGNKFRLSDLRGRIVFLEFYTTQCAPCQPVLEKLNDLVERRSTEWNGHIDVLAVGLDAVWQSDRQPDAVKEHLDENGWKSIRPIVPDQPFSWESQQRFPFGVSGVPHAFLIDRGGVILWSGFPDCEKAQQQIDLLLAEIRDGR